MTMEWISVKDRLPQAYDYVLIYAKRPGTGEPCPVGIARHDSTTWEPLESLIGAYSDVEWEYDIDEITHWMPLPAPPIILDESTSQ